MDAVTELDQRVSIESDERDVTTDRLVDESLGRRSERLPLRDPDQPLELRREVEEDLRVGRRDQVVDQADGHPPGLQSDLLLAVLVDAVVLADRTGGARLAVANVGPGEVLELERDVLGNVARPRSVAQARDEATPATERAGVVLEGGQERHQRVREVGQLVGRVLLEHAEIDQQPDDRFAGPVIRPTQDPGLEDPEGRSRTASRSRIRRTWLATGAGRGNGLGHGSLLARRRPRRRAVSWTPPRRRAGHGGLAWPRAPDRAGRSDSRPAANAEPHR